MLCILSCNQISHYRYDQYGMVNEKDCLGQIVYFRGPSWVVVRDESILTQGLQSTFCASKILEERVRQGCLVL